MGGVGAIGTMLQVRRVCVSSWGQGTPSCLQNLPMHVHTHSTGGAASPPVTLDCLAGEGIRTAHPIRDGDEMMRSCCQVTVVGPDMG